MQDVLIKAGDKTCSVHGCQLKREEREAVLQLIQGKPPNDGRNRASSSEEKTTALLSICFRILADGQNMCSSKYSYLLGRLLSLCSPSK